MKDFYPKRGSKSTVERTGFGQETCGGTESYFGVTADLVKKSGEPTSCRKFSSRNFDSVRLVSGTLARKRKHPACPHFPGITVK